MSLLAIRNLTKTYAVTPPVEVLRGLNLEVETGEKVLIVGYSGAGKSTLLNILGLLDEPSGGEYLFEDEHVEHLPEARRNFIRARKIGFVFQDFHVLGHRSVTENLELKLSINHIPHARRETMIAGALETVGLSGRADALTRLLSGGEKQRLAFARAVICDPQLILADEPTGNLDQKNAATILELLDAQAEKDVTVVVISHDERLRDWADRVLRLEDGVLHED
ncbi:ABC transporter ATP-binding protein [Mobiluncus mulieris]|uniref:ABC transporter ATP-binding protein n=1 Tax=Mobiluncus mulieris TaxID=2052 RepID=UPI00242AD04F|nr:ABC transporter ATP-binding protein [Mobiluncus mulieris]